MKIAKQMIDEASRLGVWAVKFQKRDVETIPDDVKSIPRDPDCSYGETYYEHRKALEFTIDQIRELKEYAEASGLEFVCSAFDIYSVYALAGIGLRHIKIPSQLADNEDMLTAAISAHRMFENIFVSTGMRTQKEISRMLTMSIQDFCHNRIIHFHCISAYPAEINQSNLITLKNLHTPRIQDKQQPNFGYSSHEREGAVIKYAVVIGAKYIERHFTLDKKMKGSDHKTVSSEPKEVKRIIDEIEEAEAILGDPARKLSKEEQKVRDMHMRE